jgi:hypothetical protein
MKYFSIAGPLDLDDWIENPPMVGLDGSECTSVSIVMLDPPDVAVSFDCFFLY